MTKPSRSAVYAITNRQTWRRYIGSSVNPERRWYYHRRDLKHGTHSCAGLQEDWTAFGPDTFAFDILTPSQDLKLDEQRLIVQHARAEWPLYNIRAATHTPVTTDEEVLAAIANW